MSIQQVQVQPMGVVPLARPLGDGKMLEDGSGIIPYDTHADHEDREGEFMIHGTDSQIVQIPLAPGAQVTCEPGAMCNMSDGVAVETKLGGLFGAAARMVSGESLFLNTYTNNTQQPGYIGLTPSFPAAIIPVDLSTMGGALLCKKGAYLGALGGKDACRVTVALTRNISAGCVGGLGFILQNVQGNSWIFLNAAGTVVQRVLGPGEQIRVDTRSLVAFQHSVDYDVAVAGDCAVMCCGGEGIFNALMTGPGLVLIQSFSLEKLKKAVAGPPPAPRQGQGGGGGGEGAGEGLMQQTPMSM